MKLAVVVVCLSACGGSQSSQMIDTQPKYIAWHQNYMKEQEARCKKGSQDDCLGVSIDYVQYSADHRHPDWVDNTYKLDFAKAKSLIWSYCTTGYPENPTSCIRYAENAPITLDEADQLCSHGWYCGNIAKSAKLGDSDLHDLCMKHVDACSAAEARIKDDAMKTDVAPLAELGQIDDLAHTYWLQSQQGVSPGGGDSDDDDENKCHKDTDCKGDRICQAGSCVDASAPKKATPPPPAVKFGAAPCDAYVELTRGRVASCAWFAKDGDDLEKHLAAGAKAFGSAAHKDAVAAACEKAVADLSADLDRIDCAKK